MGKICRFSLKDVKSRLLVFTEREPGTDFHLYLIEDKKIKIVFFFFSIEISEYFPLWFPVLEQQKCLQPFRRQYWLWLTRDKVTNQLENILLPGLPRYEDRQSAQIHCHQLAGRLSLIADGKYHNTSVGRNTWKLLIGSQASLQPNCNKEGFNAVGDSPSHSKARIGIIANQQNDCSSRDSRTGFGIWGLFDVYNSCGNEATHSLDNGNKHIKAMGYILVQWQRTSLTSQILSREAIMK